jgi:hypothetical protein
MATAPKKTGLRFTLKKLFNRSDKAVISGLKHSGSRHSGSRSKHSGSKHSGSKRSGSKRSGSKSNKDTSCIETKGTIGGLAHKRWDLLFGDIKNCSSENLKKIAERKEIWAKEMVEARAKKEAAQKKRTQYGGAKRTKKHKRKRMHM